MPKIEIKTIDTRKLLKSYIRLPFKLHQLHANWVPPLLYDEKRYYNKKYNSAFAYCDTIMALAYKDNVPVGRIMGIINKKYNDHYKIKEARFSYLESIEDYDVTAALLSFLEKWAKDKGMQKLIGPYGMTYFDPEGMLFEGYEHPVTINTDYSFPFILDYLKNYGFEKKHDYVVYKIEVPNEMPEFYIKIAEFTKNKGYEIISLKSWKDIKQEIVPVFQLMNICFKEIFGFSEMSTEEMVKLANQYGAVIDPDLLKIIKKDGQTIAFIVGMPNISQTLIKCNGKLFPFGIFHLKKALKKSRQLDLLLGGIHPDYQRRGIDSILALEMLKSAIKKGYKIIDTHSELENNHKVRAEMEKIGGKVYKRYRVFEKILDTVST